VNFLNCQKLVQRKRSIIITFFIKDGQKTNFVFKLDNYS